MAPVIKVGINATADGASLPLVSERRRADSEAGELGGLGLEESLGYRLDGNLRRETGDTGGGRIQGQEIALRDSTFEDRDVVDDAVEDAIAGGAGAIITNQGANLEWEADMIVHM